MFIRECDEKAMSQHAELWDYTLTPREEDVWKSLLFLLKKEDLKLFSADDFYRFGLNRYLSGNAVGSFFRKLQHAGDIEQAGYIHSTRETNNGREIRVWRLKE